MIKQWSFFQQQKKNNEKKFNSAIYFQAAFRNQHITNANSIRSTTENEQENSEEPVYRHSNMRN